MQLQRGDGSLDSNLGLPAVLHNDLRHDNLLLQGQRAIRAPGWWRWAAPPVQMLVMFEVYMLMCVHVYV